MFNTIFKCLLLHGWVMVTFHRLQCALEHLKIVSVHQQTHSFDLSMLISCLYLNVYFLTLAPGAPSNVSFPDVSLTTARIIWDVPDEPNGEILAYRVTYHLDDKGSAFNFSREFPPSDRTYRFVSSSFILQSRTKLSFY